MGGYYLGMRCREWISRLTLVYVELGAGAWGCLGIGPRFSSSSGMLARDKMSEGGGAGVGEGAGGGFCVRVLGFYLGVCRGVSMKHYKWGFCYDFGLGMVMGAFLCWGRGIRMSLVDNLLSLAFVESVVCLRMGWGTQDCTGFVMTSSWVICACSRLVLFRGRI